MKHALERFIRLLAEREHDASAPENVQDLGTLVDWLIERLGYVVHLRGFKHVGTMRRKSAGRLQLGVDMLATKPREDGTVCLYRFVLKKGPVDKAVWGRANEEGNIIHDVRLAASRSIDRDWEDFVFDGEPSGQVAVVAVHNGDFDSEALGGSRQQLTKELATQGVDLLWWDAHQLAKLAEPLLLAAPGDEKGVDAALFPPGIRPLVRLALHSLRRSPFRFDIQAVDSYLEARLPAGAPLPSHADPSALPVIPPLMLSRTSAEVPLFTSMIVAESGVAEGRSTLPAIDTIERCLCRILAHAQRSNSGPNRHLVDVERTCRALVAQYVDACKVLRARLELLQNVAYGLSLASGAERIDYPIRCLRLLGCLANAGLLSLNTGNEGEAEQFARTITKLWQSNLSGCEGPVTDDQLVELTAIWVLLLSTKARAQAGAMGAGVVRRAIARRICGLPLPALYQEARVPMLERDIRILVQAYGNPSRQQYPGFEDGASTLLAAAVYLAFRHGDISPAEATQLQLGVTSNRDPQNATQRPCYLQQWQPPRNAAGLWYSQPLTDRGISLTFDQINERDGFLRQFEEHAKGVDASYAKEIGLPALDFVAWTRWRTLPDMSVLTAASQKDSS